MSYSAQCLHRHRRMVKTHAASGLRGAMGDGKIY